MCFSLSARDAFLPSFFPFPAFFAATVNLLFRSTVGRRGKSQTLSRAAASALDAGFVLAGFDPTTILR
jgi:hypothetical protein